MTIATAILSAIRGQARIVGTPGHRCFADSHRFDAASASQESSLAYDSALTTESDDVVPAVFFGHRSGGAVSVNKASIERS